MQREVQPWAWDTQPFFTPLTFFLALGPCMFCFVLFCFLPDQLTLSSSPPYPLTLAEETEPAEAAVSLQTLSSPHLPSDLASSRNFIPCS